MYTHKGKTSIIMIIIIAGLTATTSYLFYENIQQKGQFEKQRQEFQINMEKINQEQEQKIIEAKKDLTRKMIDEQKMIEEKDKEEKKQTCTQKLKNAQTQLELFNDYVQKLDNLKNKDQKPDLAIETCQKINPNLSENECKTNINDFVAGNTKEYTDTQKMITQIQATITKLDAEC